jgi:hypothetical protein
MASSLSAGHAARKPDLRKASSWVNEGADLVPTLRRGTEQPAETDLPGGVCGQQPTALPGSPPRVTGERIFQSGIERDDLW